MSQRQRGHWRTNGTRAVEKRSSSWLFRAGLAGNAPVPECLLVLCFRSASASPSNVQPGQVHFWCAFLCAVYWSLSQNVFWHVKHSILLEGHNGWMGPSERLPSAGGLWRWLLLLIYVDRRLFVSRRRGRHGVSVRRIPCKVGREKVCRLRKLHHVGESIGHGHGRLVHGHIGHGRLCKAVGLSRCKGHGLREGIVVEDGHGSGGVGWLARGR
jgi:hypothetical protein